jgi:DNA-binding transcriptional ArsR family regulator
MEGDGKHTGASDDHFVLLPLKVLLHPRLSDEAKVMYGVLQSFDGPDKAGQRKGYVWPSLPKLSERTHKSPRRVSERLKALEEEGLIRTEHGGQHRVIRHLLASVPDARRP